MTKITVTCTVKPDCLGSLSYSVETDTRENLAKRFRAHGVRYRTGPGWLEKLDQLCADGHHAVERLEWRSTE